jgi:predicted PurR-regulated permease PerM
MLSTVNRMKQNILEIIFFLGLIIVSVGVLFLIFQPYLGALFIALIFAVIFYPVYAFFLKSFQGRESLSALTTVFVILVIILIPLFVIGAILFQETRDIAVALQNGGGVLPFVQTKINTFQAYLDGVAPDAHFEFDVRTIAENMASWMADHLGGLFTGIAIGTLNLFLMIIGLFFFLRDGKKIREIVVRWSPLHDNYDETIMKKVTIAVDSVVKGSLLIAVVQGFLTGIGFWIFGISSPVLWGFMATLASLIPSVGTAIVWIPGALYLFLVQNDVPMGIGLTIWGALIVGLIDNFLRPILIERGVKIHPFLILLSVFGGIGLFGPIGFLVGPIVLSFVFALIEVYPKVMHNGGK